MKQLARRSPPLPPEKLAEIHHQARERLLAPPATREERQKEVPYRLFRSLVAGALFSYWDKLLPLVLMYVKFILGRSVPIQLEDMPALLAAPEWPLFARLAFFAIGALVAYAVQDIRSHDRSKPARLGVKD